MAHISAAIDMDDRTQISGGMDVVKETLTSALQTPRRRVEMSVASSPSGTAFSSPYGTPSTTGGWHGPSLHDDDFEVQEMLEQVENFCSELESRCMEPLKTKCSLRVGEHPIHTYATDSPAPAHAPRCHELPPQLR